MNTSSIRLVLASASPRRAELLRAAGYAFETLVVDLDERVRPDERPDAYVARLAREKSAAALQRFLERAQRACHGAERDGLHEVAVLGADTAVVIDGVILGKPRGDEDAAAMIRRLSGRAHEVLTGVSLRTSSNQWDRVERTRVYMSAVSEEEIRHYVQTGEGRDKAGGYAIQGIASRFIPRIEGAYANVVGLPVATVEALLREAAAARYSIEQKSL